MAGPSSTVDQNILPVQAYFNLDGSFNTFIGQGQPFVVSATESIGIINTSVSGTFYPTFTAVNTGQVTTLSVTSSVYKFNPGTGELSAPFFDGFLNGTASEANNIAGGASSQLLYQTSANTTGFVPNGISGQFLVSNGTSAPSWSSVATSVTIVDQTTSSSTFYPLFYSATSGSTNTVETSSTKLQYVPSTGTFTSTVFSGSGAGLTNIPNSALTNSSFTLGSTSISLGSTTTTIAGLTSVTSTTFVGALTGNASTATTATTATNATNIGITDNTSSIATWYPMIVSNTTGNLPATTSSTKLSFVPNTGILSATTFSGSGASLTSIPNSALVNSAITINGVSTALGGSASVGTVTSVAATAGTGISVSGSPITGSGTLNITNTAPDQTVVLNNGTGISVTGTYPNFTVTNTAPSSGGTVTSVTATAPVASTGGTTPVISMPAATTSVSGYLTSTDWNTFNNKSNTTGTVTSVGTTGTVNGLTLIGGPITGSGTVTLGGTLDLSSPPAIGSTTPSTGAFTTLKTSGNTLLAQTSDQGTGVLQVTGQSTFTGSVIDKSLYLQGGNNLVLNSATLVTQNITVTANSYTLSMTGTGTITLSGTSTGTLVGSGANTVVSKTFTPTAGTLTLTPTSSCTTVQLELGTVFSGYTATTGSIITTTNSLLAPNGSVFVSGNSGFGVSTAGAQVVIGGNNGNTSNFNYLTFRNTASGYGSWGFTKRSSNDLSLGNASGTDTAFTDFLFLSYSTGSLGIYNGILGLGAGNGVYDTYLYRDAANTLAQRNSTNAQAFRLYNTYTSSSVGEWLSIDWTTTANTATISTKANGTGTVRTLATGNPLVISPGYTVATLPAGVIGMRAYVTDATIPTYLGILTGGGTVKCPVFYNGTAWVSA